MTASTASPPKVTEGSFCLSLLGLCNSLVRKCHGCQQMLKLVYMNNLIIPPPPNDLVIVSVMKRPFCQNGTMQAGKLGNVYFHCKTSCVQRAQPAFLPFLVQIPTDLRPRLLDVHKQLIRAELGLS